MNQRRQSAWLTAALPALALMLVALAGAPAYGQDPGAGSEFDTETCAACHTDLVNDFGRNPHAILDSESWKGTKGASFACVNCHGDVQKHIEAGGGTGTIFAFGDDVAAVKKSQTCLKCHADVHPRFLNSPHAKAGLDCTSCHAVHGSGNRAYLLKRPQTGPEAVRTSSMIIDPNSNSAVCQQCHGDVVAQFGYNEHHRLQEGILECTTCHDPHAPAFRRNLGGFNRELCATCHTDKDGPFVFEHASSRVEGCVACHSPHGSPNRHMLKYQRVAELCFSCHDQVPGFHSRFTFDTVCTNCHSSIHGSNFHPFFLQ